MSLVAITGCAPASPSSSAPPALATHTPTSSPAPPARAATIQIDGTGLTLRASDGDSLGRVLYTASPDSAIATLTERIGAPPVTTPRAGSACNLPENVVKWGDALTVTYLIDPSQRGPAQFTVRSDSRTTAGTTVESNYGFGSGDTLAALLAGTPNAVEQGDQVWFDLDADQVGVVAIGDTTSGTVLFLDAPESTNQDC
ncbi:MAG: hypothetical protein JWM49_1870 [Microbacteriaceae bacterium]|nr:hypothetical protein [Microbacteriaceae bacterium]